MDIDPNKTGPINAHMESGARNAVRVCLGTTSSDTAVVIHDRSTGNIAAAMAAAFAEVGCPHRLFDLDAVATRPLSAAPAEMLQALKQATVSVLAIRILPGELATRRSVLDVVSKSRLRHAHMPAMTDELFVSSLNADYEQVDAFVKKLGAAVATQTSLTVRSRAGTELEIAWASPDDVAAFGGRISPDRWENLPSGQVVVTPASAAGVIVVDRAIGDWFESRYDVTAHPVHMEIERGHVRAIKCDNRRLERELGLYLRSSTNSSRICELMMGANRFLKDTASSTLLQSYRPGASVSMGALTAGANATPWTAPVFLPLVMSHCDILVGDKTFMVDDTYVEDAVVDEC